jgi:CheY-like chemotaxis protein
MRIRAEEKGIQLTHRVAGRLPETIQTDPAKLRQIVMNLVSNAIKFTEEGGVEVVTRLASYGKKPQLAVDVTDTGVGIEAGAIDKIFEPFSQADGSVTRRYGGTGLGLAISRNFAHALGGEVDVASIPGQGSTFTLTIDAGPLDGVRLLDEGGLASAARAEVESNAEALPALPPADILLVEDGAANRELITLVLEETGVTVDTAENGQVCLDMIAAKEYDLILMDMEMPVLDGYAATARLREQGNTVPIVALTAHAMQGDEAKCRNAGCSGFLTKPVDADLLVRTLAEYLSTQPELASGNATPSTRL